MRRRPGGLPQTRAPDSRPVLANWGLSSRKRPSRPSSASGFEASSNPCRGWRGVISLLRRRSCAGVCGRAEVRGRPARPLSPRAAASSCWEHLGARPPRNCPRRRSGRRRCLACSASRRAITAAWPADVRPGLDVLERLQGVGELGSAWPRHAGRRPRRPSGRPQRPRAPRASRARTVLDVAQPRLEALAGRPRRPGARRPAPLLQLGALGLDGALGGLRNLAGVHRRPCRAADAGRRSPPGARGRCSSPCAASSPFRRARRGALRVRLTGFATAAVDLRAGAGGGLGRGRPRPPRARSTLGAQGGLGARRRSRSRDGAAATASRALPASSRAAPAASLAAVKPVSRAPSASSRACSACSAGGLRRSPPRRFDGGVQLLDLGAPAGRPRPPGRLAGDWASSSSRRPRRPRTSASTAPAPRSTSAIRSAVWRRPPRTPRPGRPASAPSTALAPRRGRRPRRRQRSVLRVRRGPEAASSTRATISWPAATISAGGAAGGVGLGGDLVAGGRRRAPRRPWRPRGRVEVLAGGEAVGQRLDAGDARRQAVGGAGDLLQAGLGGLGGLGHAVQRAAGLSGGGLDGVDAGRRRPRPRPAPRCCRRAAAAAGGRRLGHAGAELLALDGVGGKLGRR